MKISKKYEGKCVIVSIPRGRVLFSSKDITATMREVRKYPIDEVAITSVPKGKRVLIL